MTRLRRGVIVPGAIYHVTSRGNSQQLIFLDGFDRHHFLSLFKDVVDRFDWTCLDFCLVGNHFHLVVKLTEPNLSQGMHRLNWRYAVHFNLRHGRKNHMVGERFHHELVDDDPHLVSLIPYLALQAVRAGLVEHPDEWPWGGYAMNVGTLPPHSVLSVGALPAYLDRDPERAKRKMRDLVEAELGALRASNGHVPVTVTGTWP
jgi:putative transposase